MTDATPVEKKKGDAEGRHVAGTFTLACALTDKRQIQFSATYYSDDTPEDLNGRIDAAQDSIDRQVIRYDIVAKEAMLAATEQQEEDLAAHCEHLIQKRESGLKLVTQERTSLQQFDSSVTQFKTRKASLAAAIAAARKKLNGAAPPQ